MNFIIENWYMVLLAIAVVAVAGYLVYVFVHRPTDEQIRKVQEWLLIAVAEAEKELGSGTGQLKLRYVYDAFLSKFPSVARVMPFETFSMLVDETLTRFRTLLASNQKVKEYVEK